MATIFQKYIDSSPEVVSFSSIMNTGFPSLQVQKATVPFLGFRTPIFPSN